MGELETTQARRAALLLHSLSPSIRRQVVERLDAAESTRLQPLLDELAKLGVSQSLGEQLQNLTAPIETAQQQVARLAAEDVVRCLQSWTTATAARLLRAHDWPWKAQALELMPEAHRTEVLECTLIRSELAPAVLRALCERLCLHAAHLRSAADGSPAERLETNGHPAIRPQVRSRLGRLLAWIR